MRSILGVFGLVLVASQPVFAEVSGADLKLARRVLTGFHVSREGLRTGLVHARGKVTGKVPRKNSEYTFDVEIFNAFDYGHGRFRFDRQMKNWQPKSPDVTGGRFVQTPDYSLHQFIHADEPDETITVRPSGAQLTNGARPFDVRVLGCMNAPEFRTGFESGGSKLGEIFGGEYGFLTEDSLAEVHENTNGIVELTWILSAQRNVKRTIWFNIEQGYAPIRLEERYKVMEGDPLTYVEPTTWSEPGTRCIATWKEMKGTWVIESISIAETQTPHKPIVGGSRSKYIHSLSFDWEIVNGEVPEFLFTADSLEESAAVPATVVDLRLGNHPVIVKHPLVQDASKLRQIIPETPPDLPLEAAPKNRVQWLFVINVSLLLLAIVAWLYFFRQRSKT